MNEFERARLKSEKRRTLSIPTVPKPQPAIETPVLLVPKEKTKMDAVITVKVSLPYGEFEVVLTKTNILGNPRKITQHEFRNTLIAGLRPLMGEVK